MDYNLLNQYGILILIIIFICINIYYKNIINILIFIMSYLALRNMIDDTNALIASYIIGLLYGIIKNFHLLENFKAIVSKTSNIKPTNQKLSRLNEDDSNDNDSNDSNDSNDNNDNNQKLSRLNENDSNENDSDEVISEELINQFISKVKDVDNLLIIKTKRNIYNLKPTIKDIKKNKIEIMKKKLNNKQLLKPIVISNDNFIIDGHYRWFVRKNLIENNRNGLDNNNLYNENIKIVIIDYNIKKLLKKLREFKIKYNEKYLSKNILDLHKINSGKKLIQNIKHDINLLEQNYNMINKLRLV